jgi:hypothetical protein
MKEEVKKANPLADKRGLVVIGVIAIGLAASFLTGGDNKVESIDVSVKPIEIGTDDVNAISLKDKDASLTQFAKQFESVNQKLALMESVRKESETALRKELKAEQDVLKAQNASLSDEILTIRTEGVNAQYTEANNKDSKSPPTLPNEFPNLNLKDGLNFDGLNFDMEAPKSLPQQQSTGTQNPYGPNYFILKPANTATTIVRKNGGNWLNASEDQMFNSMSAPAPQSNNYNDPSAGQGQGQSVQQPQQYASAADAYKAQNENNQNENNQTDKTAHSSPRMERITIPAFSFVEVTTLHGVACPIGANAPGTKGKSQIQARPVVLPVRGIYRGPNGSSVDVGNVHLMGLCSGRRTSDSSAGRATIRVEQMSYWDEAGDSQMTSSTGYIVDTRDNEQDVYGRLDQASGRTLALESAAAAGSAFGSALSQSEYTNQSNLGPNGSTNVQQLTGNATSAATSQGIAALFGKIAQRFEQEASAAIDTVVVEPGIRLRFVTDQPIYIYKPAEAFDIDAGRSDVLL